ncbi:MAG: DUF1761 domain-containing protein [Pseudomonadales bacterium]|jgi:hypothetical protein|nr:DUF1761 domain-containing protein [Pseudomonadales bacterium]MDP7358868.1 DUF1761 domain-containing protein [Pseudomonadales bacterium]MDP7595045.1 DUF1761 domain-containing protein [Pseudomonadales bacterium]HJN52667.1 DUF1761 domain-containing protein [Pseudomonadales bacterium]|tara:strand:+ start:2168 stop:2560 length:393 start_codon:yes stop_codon:yes gene_type:complete
MFEINLLAVLAATLGSFMLGGLWYSKLAFFNVWMRESGYKEENAFHPARVFGVSFVCSLIAAVAFALALGPAPELLEALTKGLIVGVCFVATSFGINYQFATRSLQLLLIDSGYHTAQFALFGLVLGIWH